MMEETLRRAMLLSRGSAWTFVQRPVSCALLLVAAAVLAAVLLPKIRQGREEAFRG